MHVFVTGAQGMLGQDVLAALKKHGHEATATDLRMEGANKLDLTDAKAVQKMLNHSQPDVVFHLAAYTDVNGSESHPLDAYRVNGMATQNLALACLELDIPLLYISSDYVFDGKSGVPYTEYDRPAPLGVYGKSKYAGEMHIQQLLSRFFIVRTSWLYGKNGKNFVETMRNLAQTRPELTVVADQFGCPTFTVDLAEALIRIVESGRYGIYHASGEGFTTWHGFAEKIMEFSGLKTPVRPITTEELGSPAPRPAYSVLENLALKLADIPTLPHWEDALRRYLALSPIEGNSTTMGV